MIKPPPFLNTDLLNGPIEFEWRGSGAHTGSMSLTGPIGDLIDKKTTCATIILLSGITQWALWRLKDHIEVSKALQLAEAALAYQVDWRYVDRGPRPSNMGIPPHQPPLESALAVLLGISGSVLIIKGIGMTSINPSQKRIMRHM